MPEKQCRIVFYGPLGAGKTTCLSCFHDLGKKSSGKPRSFRPAAERTTRFDFIAPDFEARILLSTVSGWAHPHVDRRLLVKGADGVVFVADSSRARAAANIESLAELEEHLRSHERAPEEVPLVLFYNKRDLADVMTVEEMDASLNALGRPRCEGSAARRTGVVEALGALTKRIYALPDPILWESTGDLTIPFRALVGEQRLYVKQGEPPAEPLFTLVADGEPTETYGEWPSHWLMPRVRIGEAPKRAEPAPPVKPAPPTRRRDPAPIVVTKEWATSGRARTDRSSLGEKVSDTGERRFFSVSGVFRFACGAPAGVVLVAVSAPGCAPTESPNLLGAGLANGSFSVAFVREAFAPEGPAPVLSIVVSVLNRAGNDLIPVHSFDVHPSSYLVGTGNLGTIFLPMKKGDHYKATPGLVRLPGGDVIRKRLRLDDECVRFASTVTAALLADHVGWKDLADGVRFEVVDDFVAPMRRRVEALLGPTKLDERDRAALEASAASFEALAFWDSTCSVVYLNRRELEQQNFGFLLCTIGHELVHVGQAKHHPELEAAYREFARDAYRSFFSGRPATKEANAAFFGLMANLEGYADYIERVFLMQMITCSLQLEREAAPLPDANVRTHRAHTEVDMLEDASPPPSLRSILVTQKWAQYDSGRRAYMKRTKGDKAAPFDPALRPDPLLPEDILKPLMASALKGNVYCQTQLGDIYRTGGMVGIVADRAKALRWYGLASQGGSADATAKLRALEAERS